MSTRTRTTESAWLGGAILIAIGVALLAGQLIDIQNADLSDTFIFAAIAVVFLIALVGTRAYGFLVPTMIFAGLSGAKYAVYLGEDSGGSVLLGPGLGFLAIYAIGAIAFRPTHWWPLIPGSILTLLGGSLVFGGTAGAELAGRLWPLVLVGIGLLMLAGVFARRGSQASPPQP